MSNYNLTNQTISSSFQQLLQKNEDSGTLVNGTGSLVDGLIISGTLSASFFVGDGSGLTGLVASASLPPGVVSSSVQVSDITGSSLVTASFNNGTRNLTFTKGDGSVFALNIPDITGSIGNFVTTSSFQTYTASVNTRFNGIDTFTQSADARLDTLEAATGSYTSTSSFQTYTASVNTRLNGIDATTASLLSSVSQINTFTSSANSRLNSLELATGSINTRLNGIDTFTQSADSRLDNIEAVTGSYTLTSSFQAYTGSTNNRLNSLESKTGSYATTGSNTFVGNQIINGNLNVTGQFTASGLWYPTVDGVGDMFLSTDGAGNLEFDWVKTLHQNIHNATTSSIVRGTPLYISGSTGDNANVYFADASNVNKRPATLIAYDATLAPGATGTGIISGEIQGVNTSLYPEGTIVYLGVGGGWTATRPTGSANLVQALGVITRQANNGRGIVFNQIGNNLPNIQTGHVWVGNGNGIPTETPTASIQTDISGLVTTSSFQSYTGSTNARLNSIEGFTQSADSRLDNIESNTGSYARTDVNNNFTGTQNFVNISVSGTGSFGYLESITGSAKIIGDAFIILNNDTPTQRYAGIIVVDSGSANTTASFQFDGLTNDWFYEYTGSDPTNFGVVMFGPEYATKGSPTYLTNNRIPKGDGGHHLNDSNISDDGTNVIINSNTQITGSVSATNGFVGNLTGTASFATSASFAQNAADLRVDFNTYTSSTDSRLSNIESTTASLQSSVSQINGFTQSADSRLNNIETTTGSILSSITEINTFTQSYYSDSASFYTRIENLVSKTGSYVTTTSFEAFTQSYETDSASFDSRLDNVESTTGSILSSIIEINTFTQSADTRLDNLEAVTGSYATTGSNNFIGNQTITGTLTISSSNDVDFTIVGKMNMTGPGTIQNDPRIFMSSSYGNLDIGQRNIVLAQFNSESVYITSQLGGAVALFDTIDFEEFGFTLKHEKYGVGWTGPAIYSDAAGYSPLIGFPNQAEILTTPITIFKNTRLSGSLDIQNTLTASLTDGYIWVGNGSDRTYEVATSSFASINTNTFTGLQIISSSLDVQLGFTASLSGGHAWVGDANGRSYQVPTSSFGGGGGTGAGFPFTGSAQITGSLGVTGSIRASVKELTVSSNTASLNMNDGNFFILYLVSGSTTHINTTTIFPGQTMNLIVSQSSTGTGSINWGTNIKWIAGNKMQATPSASARDIVSFVTFNDDELFATNVKNLY